MYEPRDSGQVMVMTALLLLGLVACIVAVADLGQLVTEKVRLQAAADAGATAGAASLADTLNSLAVSNVLIILGTGASAVSGGKGALAVQALEDTQAALIKGGGAIAAGLAYDAALHQGAERALPWNRGTNGGFIRPDLMVAQEKRIFPVISGLAGTSGRVAVDKLKTTTDKPYGERYMLIAAWANGGHYAVLRSHIPLLKGRIPTLTATGEAAVTGGSLWRLLAPPVPNYRSGLVPISSRHKGASVRH